MPPAAISRSSTYLPKICGNIRSLHGSAPWLLWLLSGCSAAKPAEIGLPLAVHTLPHCAVGDAASLDLSALGDFPVSNRTSETLALDAKQVKLAFPLQTLALEATASDNGDRFWGFAPRKADRLDVLLWPQNAACELFRPAATDSFPGLRGGQGIGFSTTTGLVLAAGGNDGASPAIVGALTFDTTTGEVHVVDPRARAVLSEPRAAATVTDFAGKILVAGGENPVHDVSEDARVLRDTAEVYDPSTRSFEADLIKLTEARTHHGAVTLESGETVLVGGRGQTSDALSVVEVVSPKTRVSKLTCTLHVGRIDPVALRLDDGRVFVGGGTDSDGHPLGELEWLSPDATTADDWHTSLPPRFDRAFVAMSGGAVLAVGGCEDRAALADEDCSVCNRGCPPLPDGPGSAARYDAFWLGPNGSVDELQLALIAPKPTLLWGSDGSPWVVVSTSDGSTAVYRFDPWSLSFESRPQSLTWSASNSFVRAVSTGPDAFVWLTEDVSGPVLSGGRFGTRSTFSTDVPLVSLRDGIDPTRPAHLAPDRIPGHGVTYSAAGTLQFGKTDAGTPETCVWLTDAQFADFGANIEFAAPAAPHVRLGAQEIASDSPCPLPLRTTPNSPRGTLTLHRSARRLTLTLDGNQTQCDVGDARLPFGICSNENATTVTSISVTRGE